MDFPAISLPGNVADGKLSGFAQHRSNCQPKPARQAGKNDAEVGFRACGAPSSVKMYLVSLFEEEAVVEASLGGRVTADEARVFGEELIEMLESFGGKPF